MMQPKEKHETPQNISSVKQSSKIANTVHKLYSLSGLGGPCIYGTYIVPPVLEVLRQLKMHLSTGTDDFVSYVPFHRSAGKAS